jgi:hypothetical protein
MGKVAQLPSCPVSPDCLYYTDLQVRVKSKMVIVLGKAGMLRIAEAFG